MWHNLRVVAAAAFAALVLAAPSFAKPKGPYVLAVIPTAPPETMYALWEPFVERLSRATGIELRLKVYEKMSDFERDISSGAPDFIFANPLQAVVAHEAHGYVPLVRGSSPISAEVVVRRDSPIRTVAGLSGKKIALVGDKSL